MILFSTRTTSISGYNYGLSVTGDVITEWINKQNLLGWMDNRYAKMNFFSKWVGNTFTINFRKLSDRNDFIKEWIKK